MTKYRYQKSAVHKVRLMWKRGKSVLLWAGTSSGKTVMGARAIGEMRAAWLVRGQELVKQAAKALAAMYGGDAVGIVMPGYPRKPNARIQVYSTDTALQLPEFVDGVDVLVIDECHHYVAPIWRGLVDAIPHNHLLGLTATPMRRDGVGLGHLFDVIVKAVTERELLEFGVAVPATILRPERDLGNALAQDPVSTVLAHAKERRTIVYLRRVDDAIALAEDLADRGVPAHVIEAATPKPKRDEHVEEFRAGKVRVIANVMTMTEGVDVPEVECIVIARPVRFAGLYRQIAGRGRRAAEGKTGFLLIDLPGCSHTHGSPDDELKLERPLDGKEPRGELEGGADAATLGNDSPGPDVMDLPLYDNEGREFLPQPLPPVSVDARSAARRKRLEERLKARNLTPRVRDFIRAQLASEHRKEQDDAQSNL